MYEMHVQRAASWLLSLPSPLICCRDIVKAFCEFSSQDFSLS